MAGSSRRGVSSQPASDAVSGWGRIGSMRLPTRRATRCSSDSRHDLTTATAGAAPVAASRVDAASAVARVAHAEDRRAPVPHVLATARSAADGPVAARGADRHAPSAAAPRGDARRVRPGAEVAAAGREAARRAAMGRAPVAVVVAKPADAGCVVAPDRVAARAPAPETERGVVAARAPEALAEEGEAPAGGDLARGTAGAGMAADRVAEAGVVRDGPRSPHRPRRRFPSARPCQATS